MGLQDIKLDDKYDLSKTHSLMSGIQAIVRLTMMQKQRDADAGHNTAGYVTGYWGKWGYGGSKDQAHPVIENIQTLPTSHGFKHVLFRYK